MNRVALLCSVLLLAIAGCGGGGSEPASNPTPGAPAPATPATAKVTFNKTSIAATTYNGGGGPVDESLTFTLANHDGTYWYRWRSTGSLVQQTTMRRLNNTDPGVVSIRLINAGQLGAGTYSGTLTLTLCVDEACNTPIAGSPIDIAITYVVTGSALPTTSVSWTGSYDQLDYETVDTRTPTFEVRANFRDPPALRPLYLLHTDSQSGLVTRLQFAPAPAGTPLPEAYSAYIVTLKPPSTLGSGVFTDHITFRVCLDPACTAEIEGSPLEFPVDMTVVATQGVEVNRRNRRPDSGVDGIAWSNVTQRLYIGSSARATTYSSPVEILELDPATLATTRSVAFGTGGVKELAVTSDGQGLFASARQRSFVHHLQLPALINDYSLDVGDPGPGSVINIVENLLPLSGQPQSVLLSLAGVETGPAIVVYDGMVPRSGAIAVASPNALTTPLTRGPTADTFFGFRQLTGTIESRLIDRLHVDAGGVSRTSAVLADPEPSQNHYENRIQYANGLIYDERGNARDPVTGAIMSTLRLPEGFELHKYIVDAANNRLFAATSRYSMRSVPYLMSFELSTLRRLAVARLSEASEFDAANSRMRIVLWGTDGIALSDGEYLEVLSGRFFTTYDGSPGG
jgi:hypothetical protein